MSCYSYYDLICFTDFSNILYCRPTTDVKFPFFGVPNHLKLNYILS